MSSFESTRGQFSQEHFEIVELILPVITGACTLGDGSGFGTPLTCSETWSSEYKTYSFTNTDNKNVLQGTHFKQIKSISETVTELKPGRGLASRGSASIVINDFPGDPNVGAPGVTQDVIDQGTFFGKLNARQVLVNKVVNIKLYRVEEDGTIDLAGGALTRTYVIESLKNNGNGTWTIACKDEMSVANIGEKSWPIHQEGFLRTDIDNIVTAIPVDSVTDWSSAEIVRIGDEFLPVTSVTNNQTASATLNVTRVTSVFAPVSGALLSRNDIDEHSAGDEVFICRISDDETIDSLLFDVLTESDVDASFIPTVDWAAEVAEWHATTLINTLWSSSEKVNSVIDLILESYLMDMWFDPEESEIKLKAISVWKASSTELTEGSEIRAYSFRTQPNESLRTTRALVIYDKGFLLRSDDVSNYSRASQFADDTLTAESLFGKHKDRLFSNNQLISEDSAILLTQRTVSRFKFTPLTSSWITDERKLNFNVGDVIDYSTSEIQGPDGLPSSSTRAQVISIQPVYKKDGREYKVKAMTYEPAFGDNSEVSLSSPLGGANLYLLAGAPSTAVTITFVLNGSYSFGSVSIRAGSFPAGSKIILILANGFDGQANGGFAGAGENIESTGGFAWSSTAAPQSGGDGGTVYDAEGIDTDIYFSGATPSTAFPIADGFIRAPGGGGDGLTSAAVGTTNNPGIAGKGGGGGAGRNPAAGGLGGTAVASGGLTPEDGLPGNGGDIIGNGGASVNAGGDWGVDATTGLAGKGVVDSGATVVFFGDTPTRYINGHGDH